MISIHSCYDNYVVRICNRNFFKNEKKKKSFKRQLFFESELFEKKNKIISDYSYRLVLKVDVFVSKNNVNCIANARAPQE